MTDKDTHKFASVNLGESEADMLANDDNSYYKDQVAKITPTLAAVPDKQVLEVSLKA